MPEQGNKYNIPHLQVQKQFFPKWFEQTKRISSFGKGTAQWMFCICLCRNHFLWTFAAGILKKLNFGIFLQDYLQPNALQVATMMSLWKMIVTFFNFKFLIPTLCHMFCSPKPLFAKYLWRNGLFRFHFTK